LPPVRRVKHGPRSFVVAELSFGALQAEHDRLAVVEVGAPAGGVSLDALATLGAIRARTA